MSPATTDPLYNVLTIVHKNLQYQAEWTALETHGPPAHPRPLLTGVPPSPIYLDDDLSESERASAAEHQQREWVVPVDLREKWSVRKSAEMFDSLPEGYWGVDKAGKTRQKRVLLACVSGDSTVVYYVMHDGIVRPRQN